MNPRELLRAAARYVRDNPRALVKAATDATSLRFGVPIAALRWAAGQVEPDEKASAANASGKRSRPVKDIDLGSAPPALRFGATVDAMGTPVRATGALRIDEVTLTTDTIRIGLRLNELKLVLLGESDSPLAILIKSGALDLSKPGNLLKVLPKRPVAIIEAEGDRMVLDLMKVPALAKNGRLKKALAVITPILGIRAIETDRDHLYVALRATPAGIREALTALGA